MPMARGFAVCLAVSLTACCPPAFVTAHPSVIGRVMNHEETQREGYLRIHVTSHLQPLQRIEYQETAWGYKYISAALAVTLNGASGRSTSKTEYPFLL